MGEKATPMVLFMNHSGLTGMPRCTSVIMLPDSWPSLPAILTAASTENAPKSGVSSMPPNRDAGLIRAGIVAADPACHRLCVNRTGPAG